MPDAIRPIKNCSILYRKNPIIHFNKPQNQRLFLYLKFMPTYSYQCSRCNATQQQFLPISRRHTDAPYCCNQQTKKIELAETMCRLQTTTARAFPAWKDKKTGEVIGSMKQRTEFMKRNNYVEAEPFED